MGEFLIVVICGFVVFEVGVRATLGTHYTLSIYKRVTKRVTPVTKLEKFSGVLPDWMVFGAVGSGYPGVSG